MNKLLTIVLCLLLACTFVQAEPREIYDELLQTELQKAGAKDIQGWIDGTLANGAGVTAEWYVLSLRQSGAYDFSAYANALRAYLDSNTVRSKVTQQKYALALLATAGDVAYANGILQDTIGQQGVMSWVYGLHLLNNGCSCDVATKDTAIDALLSLQLPDGGWVITGTVSDADVTAMAVQALSPYYQTDEKVKIAVDKALVLLSSLQKDDGGYASYGRENAESIAQVWIALSALGIDGLQDARFIKNGNTLLDALLQYRTEDGFSHEKGGKTTHSPTVQTFFALTAYQRLLNGQGSIYLLDEIYTQVKVSAQLDYKAIASLVIGALALIACIVLTVIKKRNIKNYAAVIVLTMAAIAFVLLTDFQSADDYYSVSVVKKEPVGTVAMSIRCDTVAGKGAKHIPADGVILKETAFTLGKGETAYDILVEASRTYSIHTEASGAPGMKYVTGIAQLYEYDFGDLSGWIYFVNGQSHSVGCDQYELKDGDVIEWRYSCELGQDL